MSRVGFAGAAAVAVGLGATSMAAAETPLELAVKATYLEKLAPFVTWPAPAYPTADAPLVICVQGADPFGGVLDRAIAGQVVGSHPVAIRRMPRIGPDSACHIAYIGGSTAQSEMAALRAVAGGHVLTVTDQDHGGRAAGVVHLVLSDGRVRFAIDLDQARQNGLQISSKLLGLAVTVKR